MRGCTLGVQNLHNTVNKTYSYLGLLGAWQDLPPDIAKSIYRLLMLISHTADAAQQACSTLHVMC